MNDDQKRRIDTRKIGDISPQNRSRFTAHDLRQSLRTQLLDRLSSRRKRVAAAFLAAAIGAFVIVPSYAANFNPTDQRNIGVHGNIEFFPNGGSAYVPYTDGRITAGAYTMTSQDGSDTEWVYCTDLLLHHNSGDVLSDVSPGSETALFHNNLVMYHEVDFILGNWHASSPDPGFSRDEMAAAIQLAIWGETNGIFANGNLLPRSYGAGGIDGNELQKIRQKAQDLDGYTASHHADWFLSEARGQSQQLDIHDPKTTLQPGQSFTATATLLGADGAPLAWPGAQVTFGLSGPGSFASPSTVGINGNGQASATITATGPGTITFNAQITPGTDYFNGAQGLEPSNSSMQIMAYSLHQERRSNTPNVSVPVVAPPPPPPTPVPPTPVPPTPVPPTPTPVPVCTPFPGTNSCTPPTSTPTPACTPFPNTNSCTPPTPTPTPACTPFPNTHSCTPPTPTPTPKPTCLSPAPQPAPKVTITGPDTYVPGTAVTYEITIVNGPVTTTSNNLTVTVPDQWAVTGTVPDNTTQTKVDVAANVVTFHLGTILAGQMISAINVMAMPPAGATGTAAATATLPGNKVVTQDNCPEKVAPASANTQATTPTGGVQGITVTQAPALVTPDTGSNQGTGILRALLVGLFLMSAGVTVLTGIRRNPHAL